MNSLPKLDEINELQQLMWLAAESVAEAEEAALEEELASTGDDPGIVASHVKEVLKQTLNEYRHAQLREAMIEYAARSAALREKNYTLPQTPDRRRVLLASLFDRFPQMENTFLTVQHRDFKTLSDADVESFLKQLQELGVYDEESDYESICDDDTEPL